MAVWRKGINSSARGGLEKMTLRYKDQLAQRVVYTAARAKASHRQETRPAGP